MYKILWSWIYAHEQTSKLNYLLICNSTALWKFDRYTTTSLIRTCSKFSIFVSTCSIIASCRSFSRCSSPCRADMRPVHSSASTPVSLGDNTISHFGNHAEFWRASADSEYSSSAMIRAFSNGNASPSSRQKVSYGCLVR